MKRWQTLGAVNEEIIFRDFAWQAKHGAVYGVDHDGTSWTVSNSERHNPEVSREVRR
jgi:hypothetical protein